MREPNWSRVSGLYARPRSKRTFIHLPLDDCLVEMRPDFSLLMKNALVPNSLICRGHGFVFNTNSSKDFEFVHFSSVEQSFPDAQIPIYEAESLYNDMRLHLEAFTVQNTEGLKNIHLYLKICNAHPIRTIRMKWNFLSVQHSHKTFYIHPNEDYLPYQTLQEPWHKGISLTHEPIDNYRGVLLDSQGKIYARYETDNKTKVTYGLSSDKWSNALQFEADFIPGMTQCVHVVIPYTGQSFGVETAREKENGFSTIDLARNTSRTIWGKIRSDGASVQIPDSVTQQIFDTLVTNLFQLMSKYDHLELVKPGQGGFNNYAVVYTWEISYYVRVLSKLGYGEIVKFILNYLMTTQDESQGPEGDIQSAEGTFRPHIHWMSETGSVLAVVAEYILASKDYDWLTAHLSRLLKACEWIRNERSHTKQLKDTGEKVLHYGLLPKGRPHDWPHKGYFLFSDAYTWLGLHRLAQVLVELNHPEAEKWSKEAADYAQCILQAFDRSSYRLEEQQITYFPNEVYSEHTSGIGIYPIDGPIALLDVGLLDANDPRVKEVEQFLRNQGVLNDYFACKLPKMEEPLLDKLLQGFSGKSIDLYYVNNGERIWHKTWIEQGERKKALKYFWSTMAFSTSLDTCYVQERFSPQLPWLLPWQPNGSGNGRVLEMILNSLYIIKEGELMLIPCIPAEWLQIGKTIRISNMRTELGNFSAEMTRVNEAEWIAQLSIPLKVKLVSVVWPIPEQNVQSVTVTELDGIAVPVQRSANKYVFTPSSGSMNIQIVLCNEVN